MPSPWITRMIREERERELIEGTPERALLLARVREDRTARPAQYQPVSPFTRAALEKRLPGKETR